MKKVINKKIYDTDKSEKIGETYHNIPSTSDFHHYQETLYRTENGRYFIAGSGGPMSKYSVSLGSGSTGGSRDIEVVNEEEAISFLEETDQADAVMEEFPDAVEEA